MGCKHFEALTHEHYEDAYCFGCSYFLLLTDGDYYCQLDEAVGRRTVISKIFGKAELVVRTMMEEKTLKRVIRAMNSMLNLYDTDFPEPLTDKLMSGVVEVADFLNLSATAIVDEETGFILKYVMPENYEEWVKRRGKENDT